MKRSEMLSIIEESIKTCNGSYKEHRERHAKKVLDRLEEAGMLPPERVLTREEYKHLSDIEWSEYCYGEKLAKWEEE